MDKIYQNSDTPQNLTTFEALISDVIAPSPLEQVLYPISIPEPAAVPPFSTPPSNSTPTPGLELALVPESSPLATCPPLDISFPDNMDAESFYSSWVRKNILRVSKLLGVTFKGFEFQAMSLFAELEKRMLKKKNGSESNKKKTKKKTTACGSRELRRLQLDINYDSKLRQDKDLGDSLPIDL